MKPVPDLFQCLQWCLNQTGLGTGVKLQVYGRWKAGRPVVETLQTAVGHIEHQHEPGWLSLQANPQVGQPALER